MGDRQDQARPMPAGNEEAKRTPGAQGENPPSTTSEPGYGGQQGQQQPQGGQRPGDEAQDGNTPAGAPVEGQLGDIAPSREEVEETRPNRQ